MSDPFSNCLLLDCSRTQCGSALCKAPMNVSCVVYCRPAIYRVSVSLILINIRDSLVSQMKCFQILYLFMFIL